MGSLIRSSRAFLPEEEIRVRKLARHYVKIRRIGLLDSAVFCGVAAWASWRWLRPLAGNLWAGAVIAVSLVAGAVLLKKILSMGETAVEAEARRLFGDGTVQVTRIQTDAVVELEDEDPGYFFELEPGRFLYLRGQYLYPGNGDLPWPNTEFELVETGGGSVDVFCLGTAPARHRTVPLEDLLEDLPEPDSIVLAGFDTLEEDLRSARESASSSGGSGRR
jgi:hypothetical protein